MVQPRRGQPSAAGVVPGGGECRYCQWYSGLKKPTSRGTCFRFPPQVVWDSDTNQAGSRWPSVGAKDACGEFRRRAQ